MEDGGKEGRRGLSLGWADIWRQKAGAVGALSGHAGGTRKGLWAVGKQIGVVHRAVRRRTALLLDMYFLLISHSFRRAATGTCWPYAIPRRAHDGGRGALRCEIRSGHCFRASSSPSSLFPIQFLPWPGPSAQFAFYSVLDAPSSKHLLSSSPASSVQVCPRPRRVASGPPSSIMSRAGLCSAPQLCFPSAAPLRTPDIPPRCLIPNPKNRPVLSVASGLPGALVCPD